MKIRIQNLGPVQEACIDLTKKITVFCGPNNTGKTYVSYIVYALTRGKLLGLDPDENEINQFISTNRLAFTLDPKLLVGYRKACLDRIEKGLDSIFGISDEKIKQYFAKFAIEFASSDDDLVKKAHEAVFNIPSKIGGCEFLLSKATDSYEVKVENVSKKSLSDKEAGAFLSVLFSKVFSYLCFYPLIGAEIVPVERNSIYTFSKELSITRNTLVEQMQELNSKPRSNSRMDLVNFLMKRSTRYPLPIKDCLEVADDLANIQILRGRYYQFAEEIENELLHGKVSLGKEGDVLFSPAKAKRVKIPIHLTASIVKTLTSLVLYLRHRANENDLIIIDEPELNLHPDSQILLARLLAKLANHGFRLLISTHSDYIIRELNNLVMLASIPENRRQETVESLGYNPECIISKDDLGVYFFKYRSNRKVKVQELKVTDIGFDVESIDDTITAQNNISETLFGILRYGE